MKSEFAPESTRAWVDMVLESVERVIVTVRAGREKMQSGREAEAVRPGPPDSLTRIAGECGSDRQVQKRVQV